MTSASAVRPTPPRTSASLVLPLLVAVVGALVGATTFRLVGGVLWGAVAAIGLLGAFRLARVTTSQRESGLLTLGVIGSAVITHQVLTPVPEVLSPALAGVLALAWMVAGAAAGTLVGRRHRVSNGVNVAVVWAAAGALAAPVAAAFGTLELGEAGLGVGAAVTASLVIALLGAGATLAGLTGVRGIGIGAAVVTITWLAGIQVGFTLPGLIENIRNIVNIPNFWPPDFGWAVGEGTGWWLPSWDFGAPTRANPLIETFHIAIIASLVGCSVALPVAFLASKVTAPGRISYLLDRGFMNVTRTIPDLFWALVFVAGLGVGPLPGVFALFFFSLTIMSKLLSETIDAVDTGPLEAARATGATHFPAVRSSVLPQVLPNYVAYALYIFELNIRASLVLGIVGAGGIGRVLETQRSFFRFDRVFALVIVIFVLVFVIEQISVALRRRLV